MHKAINRPDRPPHPYYSQAIEVSSAARTLYISGQVGADAEGGVPASVRDQAKLAVDNLNAVLAAADMGNRHLTKLTIYLTDAAHLPDFYAGAAGALPNPPPAITLLIVKGLADPSLLVEIEGVACA
jgi:2-iminobutanoate/2-iminopropanoate deaminase